MELPSNRKEMDRSKWKYQQQRRCKNCHDFVLLFRLSLPFLLYCIKTTQVLTTVQFSPGVNAFAILPNTFTKIRTCHQQHLKKDLHIHQTKFPKDDNSKQTESYSSPPSTSSSSLSKLESQAVQRFTVSYDKLCKSCPTRIQPRVDTLTEMIMGLSKDDRTELLNNVAKRMKEENFSNVKDDKDVYTFQTGRGVDAVVNGDNDDNIPKQDVKSKEIMKPFESQDTSALETEQIDNNNTKIRNKISKTKQKFNKCKHQLIEVQHLLSFITQLLSSSSLSSSQPSKVQETQDTQDNAIYHKMDELSMLSKKELKMERLKLMATKRKVEQKIAKCRMKLYGATIKLAEEKKRMEMEVERMRGLSSGSKA